MPVIQVMLRSPLFGATGYSENLPVLGSKLLNGVPDVHTIPFESIRMVCFDPPERRPSFPGMKASWYSVISCVFGSHLPILLGACSTNHTLPSGASHAEWIKAGP